MFRKSYQHLETEIAGLVFPNPVGHPYTLLKHRFKWLRRAPRAGFLTLTPPQDDILNWIKGLKSEQPENSLLAVNIHTDIIRTFSLVYDFADFIIIDPDSNVGIDAVDISDTHDLLDELVSLRLCYERYTPVFLRLGQGTSPDELNSLLGACQLDGLDGVVVPGLASLTRVRDITLGRVPIICPVNSPADGLQALENGATLLELPSSKGLNKLLSALENKQIV
jgi:hypothetical protein